MIWLDKQNVGFFSLKTGSPYKIVGREIYPLEQIKAVTFSSKWKGQFSRKLLRTFLLVSVSIIVQLFFLHLIFTRRNHYLPYPTKEGKLFIYILFPHYLVPNKAKNI